MEVDKALEAVLREPDDCQCAFCIGAKALAHEVKRLRDIIGTTEDDVLIPDCEHFFCPQCCEETRVVCGTAYCDNCGNPDSFGEPPLPLFLSMCYSTQQAARTVKEKNP